MSGGDAILGVCFDLDGTLVDSERLQWEAYRRVLADHGIDIGLDEYRRHFIAVAGGAEYACRRYALPFDAATLRLRKAAVYHELIAAGVPPMPGARACLERLHDRWRLAVVTNSTRAEATTILDRLGLTALLHAVVCQHAAVGLPLQALAVDQRAVEVEAHAQDRVTAAHGARERPP